MPTSLTDLCYTWRRALRQPGITLSIIALLALGTGGVTAVFNPIYSTLFAPLPFPQPEQLVRIGGSFPLFRTTTGRFENEEILERIFSNTAAWYLNDDKTQIRIPDTGKQVEVNFLRVSEDFFETLGIKPLIGYDPLRSEHNSGFIVSYRFWRDELMQKNDAIGSHVFKADGSQIPIIGIMPDGFYFPFKNIDILDWRRSGFPWAVLREQDINFVGRLRPEIPPERVMEILSSIKIDALAAIGMASGDIRKSADGPVLQSLQIFLSGNQRPMLRMLGTAAILFLTLVCAGVINLLIAQGVRRKQEIATRLVYGATRWNLVFQLLRETLPLIAIGGLSGWWLSGIAGKWMWAQIPVLRSGAVNVPVEIAFWAVLMLIVILIGGLIPSFYATKLDLNTYLKSASSGKQRFFSTQEFLVGMQLSLTLALLIGVGVIIRGMIFNVDIPIGWSSQEIAVVSTTQKRIGNSYATLPEIDRDILNELSAMPEAMTAGIVFPIPFSDEAVRSVSQLSRSIEINKTLPPPQNMKAKMQNSGLRAYYAHVSTDGFKTLDIPLVIGRTFTETDRLNYIKSLSTRLGENVTPVIINQALAEQLWLRENPIGSVFYDRNKRSYEVVGVVRNFYHIPGNRNFTPTVYVPVAAQLAGTRMEFLIKLRPGTSFQSYSSNVRQRLSGFPLDWVEVKRLNELVIDATTNQRLTLQLLICFTVLGIIISGLAVYATATLAATARIKEMGIRMAMGASTWDILKLALWRGIRAILLGFPIGLFLALILCKVLSSFLVQVNIRDPFAWIISCAILLVIAAAAALIPALRVIRINPLDAIRDE